MRILPACVDAKRRCGDRKPFHPALPSHFGFGCGHGGLVGGGAGAGNAFGGSFSPGSALLSGGPERYLWKVASGS